MDRPNNDPLYEDPIFGEYAKANEILQYKRKPIGTFEAPLAVAPDESIRPTGFYRVLAEVFVLFEIETSSFGAGVLSGLVSLTIIVAIGSYVISTLTMVKCPLFCHSNATVGSPV